MTSPDVKVSELAPQSQDDDAGNASHPANPAEHQATYTKSDVERACATYREEEDRGLLPLRVRQGQTLRANKHFGTKGFMGEVAKELKVDVMRLYEYIRVAKQYPTMDDLRDDMARFEKETGKQLTYSDVLERTVKTRRKSATPQSPAKKADKTSSIAGPADEPGEASEPSSARSHQSPSFVIPSGTPTAAPVGPSLQKPAPLNNSTGSLTAITTLAFMVEKEVEHTLKKSPNREQVSLLREVLNRSLAAVNNAAQAVDKYAQSMLPTTSEIPSFLRDAGVQPTETKLEEPGSTEIRTDPQPSPNQLAPDAELASPILQMPAPRPVLPVLTTATQMPAPMPFLPIPYTATRQASPHYEPDQPNPQTAPREPVEGVDNDQ